MGSVSNKAEESDGTGVAEGAGDMLGGDEQKATEGTDGIRKTSAFIL